MHPELHSADPPFYGTDRYSASVFFSPLNSLLQQTFFKSHSDVHEKTTGASLSLSHSVSFYSPESRGSQLRGRSVSPLPRRVATVWGRQNVAAAACEGYQAAAAAGEPRSYSKYGTRSDFSPFPSVRPSFASLCCAVTACRLPRRWWWFALPLCSLPRAVKLAAALLPESHCEGDCPPQTTSPFGRAGFWEAGSKLAD